MADWRTVPVCYLKDGRVLDEQGEPLAVITGSPLRWWLGRLLSLNRSPLMRLADPAGLPLLGFASKQGAFRAWIKVFGPEGTLIARLDRDGTIFTSWKKRFTIRDGSGMKMGRIDNPRLGYEFAAYDQGGACVARGIRREVDGWEVRRYAEAATPWPELTLAFFFCVLDVTTGANT